MYFSTKCLLNLFKFEQYILFYKFLVKNCCILSCLVNTWWDISQSNSWLWDPGTIQFLYYMVHIGYRQTLFQKVLWQNVMQHHFLIQYKQYNIKKTIGAGYHPQESDCQGASLSIQQTWWYRTIFDEKVQT